MSNLTIEADLGSVDQFFSFLASKLPSMAPEISDLLSEVIQENKAIISTIVLEELQKWVWI